MIPDKFTIDLYKNLLEFDPNVDTVKYPPLVLLEVTTMCNANCIYCERKNKTNGFNEFITFDYLKKLKPILENAQSIVLCGAGETTLHPSLYNILTLIRNWNNTTSLSIITNGKLEFEESSIKLLSKLECSIGFSLDTLNAKKYEAIRVGCKLEDVISNIKNVDKVKKENNLIFPYLLISNVMSIGTLKELPDLAKDISPYVNSISMRYKIGTARNFKANKEIDVILDKEGITKKIKDYCNKNDCRLEGRPFFKNELPTNICTDPWLMTILALNGEITSCENFQSMYGNINKEGIDKVFSKHPLLIENDVCKECIKYKTHFMWAFCT